MESRQDQINRVIKTYSETLDLLNEFFGLLYNETCKSHIEENGYGCCIGGACIEYGISNLVYIEFRKRREEIAEKAIKEGKNLNDSYCEYFESRKGCIIPRLKSPICASFLCIDTPTEKKYSIDYNNTIIKETLENILSDTLGPKAIAQFQDYIQNIINSVKKVKNPS